MGRGGRPRTDLRAPRPLKPESATPDELDRDHNEQFVLDQVLDEPHAAEDGLRVLGGDPGLGAGVLLGLARGVPGFRAGAAFVRTRRYMGGRVTFTGVP